MLRLLLGFSNIDYADLDKLAIVRRGSWSNVGDHKFLEVGDQASVLTIPMKGDGRATIDFDRLCVVD